MDINTKAVFEELTEAHTTFLTTSPQLGNMQQYLDQDLYTLADTMTQHYIHDNPSLQNNNQPPLDLTYLAMPRTSGPLRYFQSLGWPDRQEDYIGKAHNAELARILQLPDLDESLRTIALSRLMADSQGRFLVLNVYLNSSDERLCAAIRGIPTWKNTVYTDAQTIDNPTTNRIFRAANRKLNKETHQEEPLNALLNPPIYSALELSSLNDPRGDSIRAAQTHKVAVEWALEAVKQWPEYSQQVVTRTPKGIPKETPFMTSTHISESELNLDELTQKSQSQHDPREFEQTFQAYLNSHADPKNQKLLENFTALIHELESNYINNQNPVLPLFPDVGKIFLGIVGTLGGFVLIKAALGLLRLARLPFADMDTLREDLKKTALKDTTSEEDNNQAMAAAVSDEQEMGPSYRLEEMMKTWSPDNHEKIPLKQLTVELSFVLNNILEPIRSMRYTRI